MTGNCEICEENYGASVVADGGYLVDMCTRCRRDFHEFSMDNEEIKAYVVMKIAQDVLIRIQDPRAIDGLGPLFAAKDRIYGITKNWVAERKDYFREKKI